MLNLLTSKQIRQADEHTIEQLPIRSINLMERAAVAFTETFTQHYPNQKTIISVYCATGNNGGDGLAIARLLSQKGYKVSVKIARFSGKSTADFDGNLARLLSEGIALDEFKAISEVERENADIVIDALLGSGLNKPLQDEWLNLVEWINSLNKPVISVDIPTGFKSEGPIVKHEATIKSALTITFQRPKINFLLPESASCIDRFEVVDIGLDEPYIQSVETPYKLLTQAYISAHLQKRKQFSHKGTYGHALIIAGAPQTMGAALLCAEASLNTGSGLTTACIPPEGLTSLNVRVPEVMASLRYDDKLPDDLNWDKYNNLAIGPGIGTSEESMLILGATLKNFPSPMVLDADALNLLSSNPEMLSSVPKLSILTPHLKEFDRLFGDHATWWERLETGMRKAKELNLIIVLKNRYTIIFTPDGKCIFNSSGTPAMASGGMGDVLTGMIVSFLAQGYSPEDAAILGVYIHGKTGEKLEEEGMRVVPAGKLVKAIGRMLG